MKLRLVILAIIISLVACKSPEEKAREAEAHCNRATELLKKEDRWGAVAELRKAVRLEPDDPTLHYKLAWALEYTHGVDPDTVMAAYREALRLKPDYAEAHAGVGECLNVKGDHDGAIREYREAIRLKPDDVDAHEGLKLVLYEKGDHAGELAEKQKIDEIRGDALFAKGDYDRAATHYQMALSHCFCLNPEDSVAEVKLGMALDKKGDLDGAIGAYREAIRSQPTNADAHSNLSAALERKGDREAAASEKHVADELKLGHDIPPPPPPPPPPPTASQ